MRIRNLTLATLAFISACGVSYAASSEEIGVALEAADQTDAYVLEAVSPEYPMEMLERGVQGRTLLMLRVDNSGVVSDVRVVSTSNKIFADAAIKSVKKWYFQPGTRDGQAITQNVLVPVDFLIEDLQTSAIAAL